MFSKAPRFPPEKPSEVPGPNHVKLPEEEGWDSYKRGAFLEKSERFPKQKPYEGPDSVPSSSEPFASIMGASATTRRPESASNVVGLRQQTETLQSQNPELERANELNTKTSQDQATANKQQIESLIKQVARLEIQLSTSQKDCNELKRELDRTQEREKIQKVKLERLDGASREANDRPAKIVAMRKELDELQKLHEEEKRAHRLEMQQLRTELERHRKSSHDQQVVLKKQNELAEAKAQDSKKVLQSAQAEITELRTKLRNQEKYKSVALEVEQLKKTVAVMESANREKDLRAVELEKNLREEGKMAENAQQNVKTAEERILNITQKLNETREQLSNLELKCSETELQLEEALASLNSTEKASDDDRNTLQKEVELLRSMLATCTQMYGVLSEATVDKSLLEAERSLHRITQSKLLKLERRMSDRDIQNQELVSLIRWKEEQRQLVSSSLQDAIDENQFVRSLLPSDNIATVEEYEAKPPAEDNRTWEQRYIDAQAYVTIMDQYYSDWLEALCTELKSTGHVSASLEAALDKVLEITAELDGKLQVAKIEADVAQKRAKEVDTEIGTLQQQIAKLGAEKDEQIERLSKESISLNEELQETQRKLEDARRRLERLETVVREKTAAETALTADIESVTDALRDALRYEHAYNSLCKEVDALVLRNELVEREADHLSHFNAEILGHTNPNQKIHYLDRIRKDLADTKQKLAVSNRQREAVLDDNDTLRNELHAYRSLSESRSRAPNVTRVPRMPLGLSTMNSSSPSDAGALHKVPEDHTLVVSRSSHDPMTIEELM
ncbi:hypothetical protein FRC18_006314 [Serendipita sp. 400]|nr:hypothetical protein FRC18_006314 [Serendipita sp. 400]